VTTGLAVLVRGAAAAALYLRIVRKDKKIMMVGGQI
jgi:hypothetical protein